MELIIRLFLSFIKGIVLLMGIAMLIGGGLCSLSIPFTTITRNTTSPTWMVAIPLAILGLLIFLNIKVSFATQAKYLALLIGGLFLVGGGLCSTPYYNSELSGLLLLNLAFGLCGYLLVRWIIKSFKKQPE